MPSPTRKEAMYHLQELAESGVLSDGYTSMLEDVVHCLDMEERGYDVWGSKDDDWIELVVARRSDLWTKETVDMVQKIHEKYRIREYDFSVDEDEEE